LQRSVIVLNILLQAWREPQWGLGNILVGCCLGYG